MGWTAIPGVAAIFAPSDITLYVPCYNAGASLGGCLDALLKQSIQPARLLIVDDGSDPSVDPLLGISGVEVIRHPENRGLAAARNTALAVCRTPLLASVDADVEAEPSWLEGLLHAMNRETVAGVGAAMYERHDAALADRWRARHMAQHWGSQPVRNPRFLYGCNALFRVEALRAAGGYDARLRRSYEDAHVCAAIYLQGWSLLYVPGGPGAACQHLRHDSITGILEQFWTWHHPVGLLRGDFDTLAGVISRIEKVNFGIFRYRFDLDDTAGRTDLLGLDALLPWVFCAADLHLHAQQTRSPATQLPVAELLAELPPALKPVVEMVIARFTGDTIGQPGCDARYAAQVRHCLASFDWASTAGSAAALAGELRIDEAAGALTPAVRPRERQCTG